MPGLRLGALFALLLTGCSSPLAPEPLIGMTVYQVESSLPRAGFVVYDMSVPLLGIEPTYTGLQTSAFTVISACGATTESRQDTVPLGVIPTADLSEDIRSRALLSEFDNLLDECSS